MRKQGDLFYVDVNGQNREVQYSHGSNDWPNCLGKDYEEIDDEYVSLNTVQSPYPNGYIKHIDTYSEIDLANIKNAENNNNHVHLQNGKRFKPKILFSDQQTKEGQQNNNAFKHPYLGNGEVKPKIDVHQQPLLKSSKIKHVHLMPNLRNCRNGDTSGIVLCEKLFGIILCQYNSKSLQRNGSNADRVLRDRKIIVQDVVEGSGAALSGQIHRGMSR